MNVLLLGGTGAIGVYLSDILTGDDEVEHIYITTRKNRTSTDNKKQYLMGDAKDVSFLESVFRKKRIDVVVDFMSYKTQEFASRIDFILRSCNSYVFLSSCRVFSDEKIIRENSSRLLDTSSDGLYLETDEYALTKARQEDILKNSLYSNWTVVRPYITYSEERLQLGIYEKEQWLYRALCGKPIVFSKKLENRYTSMLCGQDVAYFISRLIKNNPTGDCFNIVGEESIQWKDVLDIYINTIKEITGVWPQVIYTENGFVPNSQRYQYLYDRLYNRRFCNNHIKEILGEKYSFKSLRIGLPLCLKTNITNNAPFKEIDWICEAEMDRLCRYCTRIKEIPGVKNKIKYALFRYLNTFARVVYGIRGYIK